ncbi:MAG: 1-phosphofructokinase family hexose kinase [Burkholderiales bacterium]|nr:1-phosphofructokinase family hexose kinase [Burkholderiales bacterium]
MTDIITVTVNPALDVSASTVHVRSTSKLRCDQVQRHPGGGGINVARVLHRLGADCQALCLLGGPTGQLLSQLLEEEGVRCLSVPIAGHTRESFTVLDKGDGQEYRFVLPGPEIQPAEIAACLEALRRQGTSRYMVASGSLPPGLPPGFYAQLAGMVRAWGGRLVLDGSGAALSAALDHGVYMVKPSLREMREITGLPLSSLHAVRDAALQWVRDGRAEVVAVSLGDKGAVLAGAQAPVFAPALPVQVVSAVGAGDSFVAGMVWALSQGQSQHSAFAYGVAAGSAALSSGGTALCAADDVHRVVQSVQLLTEFPEMVL